MKRTTSAVVYSYSFDKIFLDVVLQELGLLRPTAAVFEHISFAFAKAFPFII
jgi:hypothetical protein